MKSMLLKNGSTLIIRDSVREDAPALVEYLYKVSAQSDFLTFGVGEIRISVGDEEAYIEACRKASNSISIVAVIDDRIVGGLNFNGGTKPRTRHAGEFGITVLQHYWGLGIGSFLMEYLIKWAKESNIIRKINLKVRSDNYRAINIYTRLGFLEEGIITREFYIKGQFYDSIVMGLQID